MPDISLSLQLKPKLSQFQQLSIKILTLQTHDLTQLLQDAATENPLLELHYHDVAAAGTTPLDTPSRPASARASLLAQLRLQSLSQRIFAAAALIIGSLDDKGFFPDDAVSLGATKGFTAQEMACGLAAVQHLDPPGIGAASLQEALLIQTRRSENAPPQTERLLRDFYGDFLNGHWQRLKESLRLSSDDLQSIIAFLKTLSLQPLSRISEETAYVRPEVEVFLTAEQTLSFRFLQELPTVSFRDDLYAVYGKDADRKTKTYLHKARRSFIDLETALRYRRQSISRTLEIILQVQHAAFVVAAPLKPLLQKDIAAAAGLSEATICRVCRDRYLLFNNRLYSFHQFLAQPYACGRHSISDDAIKRRIADLIANEDPRHPWSDQELTDTLCRDGITIARRTVAKLRLQAGIPKKSLRKVLGHN